MDNKELIRGAYELHVHSAPDVLPRKMDDIDMAQRIKDSGMAGYAIKSHFFCTSERAQLMHKIYPEVDYIGTITLNSSVGSLNPSAMEMAARSGVKLVWFPTCDNEHERAHTFNGDPNKKLPFWARIIIEMKEAGIEAPTVNCLDEKGELKKEVLDIFFLFFNCKGRRFRASALVAKSMTGGCFDAAKFPGSRQRRGSFSLLSSLGLGREEGWRGGYSVSESADQVSFVSEVEHVLRSLRYCMIKDVVVPTVTGLVDVAWTTGETKSSRSFGLASSGIWPSPTITRVIFSWLPECCLASRASPFLGIVNPRTKVNFLLYFVGGSSVLDWIPNAPAILMVVVKP